MPRALNSFTPFGYLRNPGHRARSWGSTSGGNLRTSPDYVGVEWVYPVGRDPSTRAGLALETIVDSRACRTRADFDAIGLTSRYHSCSIVGFDWQTDGVRVEAHYFLASDDALCARIVLTNGAIDSRRISLSAVGRTDPAARPNASGSAATELLTASRSAGADPACLTVTPCPHVLLGAEARDVLLGPGEELRLLAVLARAGDVDAATRSARQAIGAADGAFARLVAEDAQFWATSPTLSGDWPTHWCEGLHHDFETTRLIVQPPRGIFRDVWPSWMSAWPRVVLAEGTLDMLRLAYADPALAQRAVLSLFRDAPQPNVPCVFEGGEYNMVAADGSRCGTSPAWCLPFLNLELLYLRTLDRDWLGQVYPFAAAYLEWWLEHRVDAQGWVVYKCTWESGEDGNPRLDPGGSGDADISSRLRPVELQATLAHAAGVLAFFASELQLVVDVKRWQRIEQDYRDRTRRLFDADRGRFRDWLIGENRFQEPCPDRLYWGVDACQYSAQSLTPLLIGEHLPEEEVWRHACAPWMLWPSWTYALVESAAAAGLYEGIGAVVSEIIDRVYRVTTRRKLGSLARPMPGSAPEFWPEDWRTYGGSDAYGWGATTANLLIRHIFGFKESRRTDGWVAELTPALPPALLERGNDFGMRQLNYRGLVFDLAYRVAADGLEVDLSLPNEKPRTCRVSTSGKESTVIYVSDSPAASHTFAIGLGRAYTLRLG